jgi:hypothetical protein
MFTGGPLSGAVSPTMLSVNLPSPPSDFRMAQVRADLDLTLTDAQRINREIAADPNLRDRSLFIENFDEPSVHKAIADINVQRRADGLPAISQVTANQMIAQVREDGPTMMGGPAGISHVGEEGISLGAMQKFAAGDFVGRVELILPVKTEFLDKVRGALPTESIMRHELGHMAGGVDENVADATMVLARIARGESGMADKIKDIAAWRDLNSDPEHAATSDLLLRIRQELIANPDKLRADINGKTPSELEKMAATKAAEGPGLVDVKDVTEFARAKIAADRMRTGDDGGKKFATLTSLGESGDGMDKDRIKAIDSLRPDQLDVNVSSAVQLLRIQQSVEANTQAGKNNGLSKAIPAIEAAHPQVFADARQYIKEHYEAAAPAAPAATAAPARKSSGPQP